MQFDRHLGTASAEFPVTIHSGWKSLNTNLAASRFHEIFGIRRHLVSE